jgi:prepilin peptidase CpaA
MLIDEPLTAAITVSLLLVVTLCAITDILEHRIPNIVLLPALLLALVCHSLLSGLPGVLDCILGLALGMAVLSPFYFLGGTSAGDVKLLGVVGALFGANGALVAAMASLVFGGVLGVLFIVWRAIEPILATHIAQIIRSDGPTGPALIGTMTRDGSGKSRFPYAPAIACGTYYSLWHLGYFSQVGM